MMSVWDMVVMYPYAHLYVRIRSVLKSKVSIILDCASPTLEAIPSSFSLKPGNTSAAK